MNTLLWCWKNSDFLCNLLTLNHTFKHACILCCCWTCFFGVFPACLAVTANTIRDLCVLCKQRLCAASVVHHGRLPAAFSAALSISTVRPVMILTTARVRVCLHSRSHETWSRSSLKCKIIQCGHFTVRDNEKDALLVLWSSGRDGNFRNLWLLRELLNLYTLFGSICLKMRHHHTRSRGNTDVWCCSFPSTSSSTILIHGFTCIQNLWHFFRESPARV